MAFVVGVTLLVFCVVIVEVRVRRSARTRSSPSLHGFLFMIHALLCPRPRLPDAVGIGLFFMVVAGMIPFLSFVGEVKVSRWVKEGPPPHPEAASPDEARDLLLGPGLLAGERGRARLRP